jgi:TolB-like protein
MKKMVAYAVMMVIAAGVFAQQLPTVAVATFEPVGGVSRDEANVVTELFTAELVSTGAVKVADRANFDRILAEMQFQLSDWSNDQKTAQLGRAINAEYIIYGQFMKMGTMFYLTATMLDINTAQRLYSAREQFRDMGEIFGKLSAFAAQMLDNLPMPNYFIGRWQCTTQIDNRICILDFKADGKIVVERFDESSYNGTISGKGDGIYSFDRKEISISLSLTGVRRNGTSTTCAFTFNALKNSFQLQWGLWYWSSWEGQALYGNFIKI